MEWENILNDIESNKISELDLRDLSWTLDIVEQLTAALSKNTSITKLTLVHTKGCPGDEVAKKFADVLRTNKTLNVLCVIGIGIGDIGAIALANMLKVNSTIAVLDLCWNLIGDVGAEALAEVLQYYSSPNLKAFEIEHNAITEEGGTALIKAWRSNQYLNYFSIGKNPGIGSYKNAKLLAEGLKNNKILTTLMIGECGFDENGLIAIFSSLKTNNTLRLLNIYNHPAMGRSHEVMTALSDMLSVNNVLSDLNIAASEINADGIQILTAGLQKNHVLSVLYLYQNSIGSIGAMELSNYLEENSSLTVLYMYQCDIGNEGAKKIAEALKHNNSLLNLAVMDNKITISGMKVLKNAIRRNTSLMFLYLKNSDFDPGWVDDNNQITDILKQEIYELVHHNRAPYNDFMAAIKADDIEKIKELILSDRNNIKRMLGINIRGIGTPLIIAKAEKNLGAIRLLQLFNASSYDIEAIISFADLEPLIEVVMEECKVSTLESYLIHANGDINIQDPLGNTLLMRSRVECYAKNRDYFLYMLENSPNLYMKNKDGNTIFDIAITNKDILKYLMLSNIKNLVFVGGEVKAAAHLGLLSGLYTPSSKLNLYKINQRILGASSGAMFGLLYGLGYDGDELHGIFLDENNENFVNFIQFLDGNQEAIEILQGNDFTINDQNVILSLFRTIPEFRNIVNYLQYYIGIKQSGLLWRFVVWIVSNEFTKIFGELGTEILTFVATTLLRMFDFIFPTSLSKPLPEPLSPLRNTPDFLNEALAVMKILAQSPDKFALFKGDVLLQTIEKWIYDKSKIKNATFLELHKAGFKDMYFFGYNLEQKKIMIFSWETTPNIIVAHAVRISASISIFHKPRPIYEKHLLEGITPVDTDLYITRCVGHDHYINFFDKEQYLPKFLQNMGLPSAYNDQTLALILGNEEHIDYFISKKKWPETIVSLLEVFYDKQISDYRISNNANRTIYANTVDHATGDFNLDKTERNNLYKVGKEASQKFLDDAVIKIQNKKCNTITVSYLESDPVIRTYEEEVEKVDKESKRMLVPMSANPAQTMQLITLLANSQKKLYQAIEVERNAYCTIFLAEAEEVSDEEVRCKDNICSTALPNIKQMCKESYINWEKNKGAEFAKATTTLFAEIDSSVLDKSIKIAGRESKLNSFFTVLRGLVTTTWDNSKDNFCEAITSALGRPK